MKKFLVTASKVYKPELLKCPKCGEKLVYKHAVSNKVVQFSSGKHFKIINLGYGCPNCNDGNVYISETANKLSFKGYTYSAKLVCMIHYYKNKGLNREEINNIFDDKNVVISDRNIDLIYKKFSSFFLESFDALIKNDFENMYNEFNKIRLALDVITICEKRYLILYNFFTGKRLAIWIVDSEDLATTKEILTKYLVDERIDVIATVRSRSSFFPLLKSVILPNVKLISFSKF